MATNNGRETREQMDWMTYTLPDWDIVRNENGEVTHYEHRVTGGREIYNPDTGERTDIEVDE